MDSNYTPLCSLYLKSYIHVLEFVNSPREIRRTFSRYCDWRCHEHRKMNMMEVDTLEAKPGSSTLNQHAPILTDKYTM